jgi:hypothetical protein
MTLRGPDNDDVCQRAVRVWKRELEMRCMGWDGWTGRRCKKVKHNRAAPLWHLVACYLKCCYAVVTLTTDHRTVAVFPLLVLVSSLLQSRPVAAIGMLLQSQQRQRVTGGRCTTPPPEYVSAPRSWMHFCRWMNDSSPSSSPSGGDNEPISMTQFRGVRRSYCSTRPFDPVNRDASLRLLYALQMWNV